MSITQKPQSWGFPHGYRDRQWFWYQLYHAVFISLSVLRRNNEAANREPWSGCCDVLKYNIHMSIPLPPPQHTQRGHFGLCQLSSRSTLHWKAMCNYFNDTLLNESWFESCEQLRHKEPPMLKAKPVEATANGSSVISESECLHDGFYSSPKT